MKLLTKIQAMAFVTMLAMLTMFASGCKGQSESSSTTADPIMVTEDNFPQAFTNMRFGAIVKKLFTESTRALRGG